MTNTSSSDVRTLSTERRSFRSVLRSQFTVHLSAFSRVSRSSIFKRALFLIVGDTLAYLLATLLNFGTFELLSFGFPAILAVQLIISQSLGAYRLKWSTYSLVDVPRTVAGSLCAGLMLLGLVLAQHPAPNAQHPVLITCLNWMMVDALACIAFRSSKRFVREALHARHPRKRAVLVALSEKSYFLLDALKRVPDGDYRFIGFVDPEPANQRVISQGLPVLGDLHHIEDIVRRHRIETVIVFLSQNGLPTPASPHSSHSPIQNPRSKIQNPLSLSALYSRLHALGNVEVKTIPSLVDLLDPPASGFQELGTKNQELASGPFPLSDLTGRPPVTVKAAEMQAHFGGKRIMVTGAGGTIGSELCRQIARFQPAEIVLFERDDSALFYIERDLATTHPGLSIVPYLGDITREHDVAQAFALHRPQIIFHAAAHKHVPILEFYPDDAIRVNVLGAHVVARHAAKHNAQCFVYISTDQAVNPTSVMGASKRIAEMTITSMNGLGDVRYLAVRFGNVLDSRGSVTTVFSSAIAQRRPITITHPDIKRHFILTHEAALLIMQAAILAPRPDSPSVSVQATSRRPQTLSIPGSGVLACLLPLAAGSSHPAPACGPVYTLDIGDPIRIHDLALMMIRRAGLRPHIDIPLIMTGLRPGEKLLEQPPTPEERPCPTAHPRIYQARTATPHTYPEMLDTLKTLEALLASHSSCSTTTSTSASARIITAMRETVPTYVPDPLVCYAHPTASRSHRPRGTMPNRVPASTLRPVVPAPIIACPVPQS